MPDQNEIHSSVSNQRTEEVAYIIDHMPDNFGIIITLLVLLLIGFLLGFGCFIKYPDILKGQITISSRTSPVKLVANTSGRIQLMVKDNVTSVAQDQYIAVIKNAAEVDDVKRLKTLLKEFDIHQLSYSKARHNFPENLALGELNNKYFSFLDALYKSLDYYKQQPFIEQKSILEKLLSSQQNILKETYEQYKREKSRFSINHRMYQRDSILYVNRILTKNEIDKSSVSLISSEQQFKSLDKDITNNRYQIDDARDKIKELTIQKTEKENQLNINLVNTYNELDQSVREWEHKYVFISPIKGKLDLLNFWKNDDFIESGKEIFAVVPVEHNMLGQVQLPEQGAGKVKIGQQVIIKLDNYPYTQYGSVKGYVKSVSLITNQQSLISGAQKINSYLVTVSLPNKLKTNYGAYLTFHFNAQGSAEIVTNEERLIERLFDNLKHETK